MRFLLIISLIILSLAITSCGNKEQSTENKKEITEKEDAPTSVDAVIPLGPIGLVSESLHKEPKKDPWKGEVFNDLADSQLKELGKIIKNPNKSQSIYFISEKLFAKNLTNLIFVIGKW